MIPQGEKTNLRLGDACPFLGMDDDPTTHYGYASGSNCCHRVNPPETILRAYQEKTCLTTGHRLCPVIQSGWQGPLPPDAKGLYNNRQSRRVNLYLILGFSAVMVLLAAGVGAWWGGWIPLDQFGYLAGSPSPTAAPVQQTPTLPVVVAATTAAPTATEFVPAPTTALPSSTPSAAPQPTLGPPTPGPLLETPFGVGATYLLHTVLGGESLPYLAQIYQTSEEVLLAANTLQPGATSFWPGTVLVILPGAADPEGVPHFEPLYLEQDASLQDLAAQYEVSEGDLRRYNSLSSEDLIPAGRWLIIPQKE